MWGGVAGWGGVGVGGVQLDSWGGNCMPEGSWYSKIRAHLAKIIMEMLTLIAKKIFPNIFIFQSKKKFTFDLTM